MDIYMGARPPGGRPAAGAPRAGGRAPARPRIIYTNIKIIFFIQLCFVYKPSLFEVLGRITLFIILVSIISFMGQSMGSWGSSYDVFMDMFAAVRPKPREPGDRSIYI